MSDNQIIHSIKNQIQLHPWPWLFASFVLGGALVAMVNWAA